MITEERIYDLAWYALYDKWGDLNERRERFPSNLTIREKEVKAWRELIELELVRKQKGMRGNALTNYMEEA